VLKRFAMQCAAHSIRAARKLTIPIIAADIGVSKSKIASAVPKVVPTKAGDLSARWTVSKLRVGLQARRSLVSAD
jgi:hypothetical protein